MKEEKGSSPEVINPLLKDDSSIREKIYEFGKLKYSMDRIVTILCFNEGQKQRFYQEFSDLNSELRLEYEKGVTVGDIEIDLSLNSLAKKGDNDAVIELGKRQYHQRLDVLRKQLFGI